MEEESVNSKVGKQKLYDDTKGKKRILKQNIWQKD